MRDYPSNYFKITPDNKVLCTLCPRGCKLNNNTRGVCHVRMAKDNRMVLSSYGAVSGFAVDPIEKKPLNHFLPGSSILSFGGIGCNLTCKFCQNCNLSSVQETNLHMTEATVDQIISLAKNHNCKSVAFTYNEPVISHEFVVDISKKAKDTGIRSVAVTNGYINQKPAEEFFRNIDAANVDLKGFTDSFYKKLCSASIEPVKETLIYLAKHTDVWLEITTLLIPDENDSIREVQELTSWIATNLGTHIPLHFSAFHPAHKMTNKTNTKASSLHQARDIGLNNGLKYVYTGNIISDHGDTTFCHHCKAPIIKRLRYQITEYNLDTSGNCKACKTKCHGVF